ncbi:MAG: dihydrolipoyl dehydrogenase [Caedibacter sp. 37-49]|nr:MAG: dihydrolipoyl dehydrogenase [Caedibacter sp. 37-49]
MTETTFDIVIIGAGPGGYVTAIRAAQLGFKTAIIEANHLGGICLNWGCIPTKALLRSAEILDYLNHADQFGLKVGKVEIELSKIVERSRQVATQLSKGVEHLLKKNKVTVYKGYGKLKGKQDLLHKIEINQETKVTESLLAKNVIVATGARARTLPNLQPDGEDIWTYREAMVPKQMLKSLLVIGSGAIGIEFASFYRSLGADVTVVEVIDRILPAEDEEISLMARKMFEKRGIKFHTTTSVTSLVKSSKNLKAVLESQGKKLELEVEKAILSIGIVGNVENLGLEGTKIKIENSHIVVNEWAETGEPGIYAIGDVAGAPWLAHKASHEGITVVEKIAGHQNVHPIKRENIPGCTYSTPQVASIGLTEKKAKEWGYEIKVGRFPFIGNGKAIALGEPEGLVKTIFDAKTGELLGAHMIGAEVTELIQGYAIAKTCEATEAELMATIFPHPTLSEMMHESPLAAFGRAIHY